MINLNLVIAVTVATVGTVLTAAQISDFDIHRNRQSLQATNGATSAYAGAGNMADDPARESGDLIIACELVEDKAGHLQWMSVSSDMPC